MVGFGVTTQTSEAIHFQVMTSNASVTHAKSGLPGCHLGGSLVDVNWPQLMKKQNCPQLKNQLCQQKYQQLKNQLCQKLKKQLCQEKTMLMIDVN